MQISAGKTTTHKREDMDTELIIPVEEMLKYICTEANLKNGYHLSDILTKTCFVYKDEILFDQFEKGVFEIIEKDSDELLNVKRIVYRSTTLFISALGRMYKIRALSSFEVITELCTKKHITEYAKHKACMHYLWLVKSE